MRKKADERFANAREMRAALRAVIGAPTSTPVPLHLLQQGPSSSPRSAPFSHAETADTLPAPSMPRPPSKVLAAVAGAMVLLAALGWVALRAHHTPPPAPYDGASAPISPKR